MTAHQHIQDLKETYAAYEPYLDSVSFGRTSSASSRRSLSSLSSEEQDKLIASLRGLRAGTHVALLSLCAALDVEGRRTDPDGKVQALMVQSWSALNRTKTRAWWLWRREVCAFPTPTSLETILGGVAWSVGGGMRASFLQCVYALYSTDVENSGGVALTPTSFAMLWRTPGGAQLECNSHWAEWLEGRRVGLVDLLENEDFWNSAPFHWLNSYKEVDRLLAFVDARQCPFQPTKVRRRPTAAWPKSTKPSKSLRPPRQSKPAPAANEAALVKRRNTLSTFSVRSRIDYDAFAAAHAPHVDKTLAKRIMAVLASEDCDAYADVGMPDPRVIAAAFANLTVEFRHWA